MRGRCPCTIYMEDGKVLLDGLITCKEHGRLGHLSDKSLQEFEALLSYNHYTSHDFVGTLHFSAFESTKDASIPILLNTSFAS